MRWRRTTPSLSVGTVEESRLASIAARTGESFTGTITLRFTGMLPKARCIRLFWLMSLSMNRAKLSARRRWLGVESRPKLISSSRGIGRAGVPSAPPGSTETPSLLPRLRRRRGMALALQLIQSNCLVSSRCTSSSLVSTNCRVG